MTPSNRFVLQLIYLFTTITAAAGQACGVLNGYTNAQAPSCTGQASICTFSGTQQGCCDGSGHCTFYTSCNGGLAATPCTDASCLQCPKATPYCARYALGPYEAFGCGIADVGNSIIYGSATIPPNTATLTSSVGSTLTTSSRSQASSVNLLSSSLASSTQSSQSSLSSSLSTALSITSSSTLTTSTFSSSGSQSSSQSSSTTKTSSAATFTGTSAATFQASKSVSLSGGAIGGIAAGIVVVILLSALAVWFFCCRGRRRNDDYGRRAQLQQGRSKAMSTYSDHYSS